MSLQKSKISREKIVQQIIEHHRKNFMLDKDIDANGYLKLPEENLIEPFRNWDNSSGEKSIKSELLAGAGGELNAENGLHFLAVHSSSALCVNNFAPIKANKKEFLFLGNTDFITAEFEKPLPTGLQRMPHLDFYLENETTIIGIESKFTEYFKKQAPNRPTKDYKNNLEPYYHQEKLQYLPNGFQENIIEHYFGDDIAKHLDIAQLIKHTIGLLHNKGEKKAVLVYLYWEPLNPSIDNLFEKHRYEITDFKKRIEPFIEFVPMSYPKFWERYKNDTLLEKHIRKVKERYAFALNL
jgi:hypothetical protein